MTETQRDFIADALGRLLTAALPTTPKGFSSDTQRQKETDILTGAQSLGVQFLSDVNRIADAIEKLGTFSLKSVGGENGVTLGGFNGEPKCPECGMLGRVHAIDCRQRYNEPLSNQTERLASFITRRFPGEPSQSIDTAIRLLSSYVSGDAIRRPPDFPFLDGSAEDFATWLTVQPNELRSGANHPSPNMWDAIAKYRKHLLDKAVTRD